MQFNISKNPFDSERISINLDDTQKVKDVKIYTTNNRCKKWYANVACATGYATKILGTDGNEYIVNLRSLGKAFAIAKKAQDPITKSVKDAFAQLFFDKAGTALKRSEFMKELQSLIFEGEGNAVGFITLDLRALNQLFTTKPYLNTVQERQLHYDRIRSTLLQEASKDPEKQEKINICLPPSQGMEVVEFEKLIDMLRQIKLPEE